MSNAALNEIHNGKWVEKVTDDSSGQVKVTVRSVNGDHAVINVRKKPFVTIAFKKDSSKNLNNISK